MIKKIAILNDPKFILSCDGDSLEVIGNDEIVEQLRAIVASKKSTYNGFRQSMGDSFDPVDYLATSSMTFMPTYHEYSKEKLEELKKII
jgi:hypothetical protein